MLNFSDMIRKAYSHMIVQNNFSNYGEQCRYRVNDNKCAFGIFISDEDYVPKMDDLDMTAKMVLETYPLIAKSLNYDGTIKEQKFVADLQRTFHDSLVESLVDPGSEEYFHELGTAFTHMMNTYGGYHA